MTEYDLPYGGVAQLGEHLPCKQGVRGSNPLISIIAEIDVWKDGIFFMRLFCIPREIAFSSILSIKYGLLSTSYSRKRACPVRRCA